MYVRPAAARILAQQLVRKVPAKADRERYERLTERERDVLRMTAQGYSAPEIGARLSISPKTVDTYKQRVNEKLGLSHSVRVRHVRGPTRTPHGTDAVLVAVSPDRIAQLQANWRAANYLSVTARYLRDNLLLRAPLTPDHQSPTPWTLGHCARHQHGLRASQSAHPGHER